MNANTNGFNYSSDYQGHNGSTILILLVIFIGVFMIGSFKKDVPDNSYNNYGDSYDNSYGDSYGDYDDSNDNEAEDSNGIDDNAMDNNEQSGDGALIDHGYFEYVQ